MRPLFAFALLALSFFPRPAAASFLATMRARPVRLVTLPPDATAMARIRLSGVFSFFDEATMTPYPARCGSVDFFCRGDLALCRREWADIEAAAAAGRCVAVAVKLWSAVGNTVMDPTVEPQLGNPYDAIMGVATIPCHPEPPGPLRPDLTLACNIDRPAADASAPPQPPQPPTTPPPPTPPTPQPPPPSPDAGDPPPVDDPPIAKRSGCQMGGGTGGLWLAALALARLRRRRG